MPFITTGWYITPSWHGGQDKKADFLQKTFLRWMKIVHCFKFRWNSFPKVQSNIKPTLVQIMARCQTGDSVNDGLFFLHICASLGLVELQTRRVSILWPFQSRKHQPNQSHKNAVIFLLWETTSIQLISPWTKWPPFRRWYFQMHVREWKVLNFD